MTICDEEFDSWNIVKKVTQKDKRVWTIKNREIYWLKVGKNIGFESFGKNEDFLRPVIVLKKFSNDFFLGVPLTTKIKDNKYYFSFIPKNSKRKNSAMITQVRAFSTKRIKSKFGKISQEDFSQLKESIKNMIG